MTRHSRLFAAALAVGMVAGTALHAAEKPKEIRVDWATYNPVSMLLKDKGFLERELAKDGIAVRWVLPTRTFLDAKHIIRPQTKP